MSYYNKKYIKKVLDDPLPLLAEDERIYLNVPYGRKAYAQSSNCGFDPEKKLWYTGLLNANLRYLVKLYGVNDATSEKAMVLLQNRLKEIEKT